MKGARHLSKQEIQSLAQSFYGEYEVRNRTLFKHRNQNLRAIGFECRGCLAVWEASGNPGTKESDYQGKEDQADSP